MFISYPQMLMVQKMMITRSLVLVTIVLLTGISHTNLTWEPIVRAQNYLTNENGSNGLMNTAEVTIAKGAANLGNRAFSPDPTNVNLGQNVTWTNGDSQFHTVTSGTGPDDPNVANEFDSKALSPGEKFLHVFNNESLVGANLAYFCQIHPAMVGTITIGER